MATRLGWEMPPSPWEDLGHPPTSANRATLAKANRAAAARASAAIRLKKAERDAEERAMAQILATERRAAERREWLATHPAPRRSELEQLRAMFPNLNPRKRKP